MVFVDSELGVLQPKVEKNRLKLLEVGQLGDGKFQRVHDQQRVRLEHFAFIKVGFFFEWEKLQGFRREFENVFEQDETNLLAIELLD